MSAAIRRLRRPWTVLSRAWGSFVPTAHNPMGGIRPCGPNERPSGRLSSRTRKLVRAGRHSPSMEAVGRFRLRSWRSCPRRTPRPFRIRPPRACRIASDPHFFRNGSFTDRRIVPVSSVTRIQSPIKGKDLKKRLSPKSPNTLIHSYVTFYIFLIFQYLSLWKSVFSSD
jgi:hypothetical protein